MSKFKKKKGGELPAISTASLPDIVFMLLFFFMVATVMRENNLKIENRLPQADQTEKLDKKNLVMYIYAGKPSSRYAASAGTQARIQLNDKFAEVSDIDAHQAESGDYYYTVYGSNDTGELVVDYFKTTEAEVQTETYNYIEMTARTMAWPPRRKCREATSFPFPGGTFCHPDNPGYICGIQVSPWGGCFLY